MGLTWCTSAPGAEESVGGEGVDEVQRAWVERFVIGIIDRVVAMELQEQIERVALFYDLGGGDPLLPIVKLASVSWLGRAARKDPPHSRGWVWMSGEIPLEIWDLDADEALVQGAWTMAECCTYETREEIVRSWMLELAKALSKADWRNVPRSADFFVYACGLDTEHLGENLSVLLGEARASDIRGMWGLEEHRPRLDLAED